MPWLGTLVFLWAAVECGWRVEGDGESPACPLFSSQLMSRCSHTLAKVWFSRLWGGAEADGAALSWSGWALRRIRCPAHRLWPGGQSRWEKPGDRSHPPAWGVQPGIRTHWFTCHPHRGGRC